MNKQEYSELLKDERWQALRVQIIKRDKYKCVKCGKGRCQLHVHHKLYITGKNPWEYNYEHLETLCAACHKKVHDNFNIPVFQSILAKGVVQIAEGTRSSKPKKTGPKKKKLKPWEKRAVKLKKEISATETKEAFIQKIGTLYYSTVRKYRTDKKKRQKIMCEIRKYQREYIEQFGTDYEGIPIELVNKLFLNWDG